VEAVKTTARLRDERGLIGKVIVLWLLLLAVFAVAAVDTGSILLARFKVSNAADTAAFQAATEYKASGDRAKAYEAAAREVQKEVPGARIPSGGFSVDPATGDVTVRVVKKAWSLVAGRLSFTKSYVKVSATSTAEPPTL
jgi:uncharacterized membrane protein